MSVRFRFLVRSSQSLSIIWFWDFTLGGSNHQELCRRCCALGVEITMVSSFYRTRHHRDSSDQKLWNSGKSIPDTNDERRRSVAEGMISTTAFVSASCNRDRCDVFSSSVIGSITSEAVPCFPQAKYVAEPGSVRASYAAHIAAVAKKFPIDKLYHQICSEQLRIGV